MSTEDNKALVRRRMDAINEKNWAAYDEMSSPDIVLHNASMTIQGLEAHRKYVSMLLRAFPDLHFTVEDLIAEGDKVVERYTARGTHTGTLMGTLMGIAPTGKQFTMTAIGINHLANDKVVEQGSTLMTWDCCNSSVLFLRWERPGSPFTGGKIFLPSREHAKNGDVYVCSG